MSEKMTPIGIDRLLDWITKEYEEKGSIFGVRRPFKSKDMALNIFNEKIETPIGPAAGPNTQLTQNIVASYVAGARFFELKTVQEMDGDALAACVNRPCIKADDECYNCEWSTELYVHQAQDEYIKAWCILKVISKAYGLGDPDGFVFNMSVGYNLDDIKKEKTDTYINNMMDASDTPVFKESIAALKKYFPQYSEYIDTISPKVSSSLTISTLHGCPPDEIERIATYMLKEKHLHTYIKCNPTILGYESAREILDSMGYEYIAFDDHHFKEDLQWDDAVAMFSRLMPMAKELNLDFGLKLSNTFPVDVDAGQLPSDEMYMAGKSLFPLTTEMANRVSKQFDGKLKIAYSGGADFFNIDKLFSCGIWPVTVATTILKPGGYQRFSQLAEKLQNMEYKDFTGVDVAGVSDLAMGARKDKHHIKAIKPLPSRKSDDKVPFIDCYIAPCSTGCPIHQDIPEYIKLCEKGLYKEALYVITQKNPVPFITGTICAHNCMTKCTRNFYESPVKIRSTKLIAAEKGYDDLIKELKPKKGHSGKKVAIIGAGPTGISAAYLVAREGIEVTVFEKDEKAGGIVRNVIPGFRISDEVIEKDVSLAKAMGANFIFNMEAPSVDVLKSYGYTHILFCVGAYKNQSLGIDGNVLNVIEFLRDLKSGKDVSLGENVVIVGGGNTAMDAARAAKRADGVKKVTIAYRRTKKEMPADEDELIEAIEEGVEFAELVAPVEQKDGVLVCDKMELGEKDNSGRRRPVKTGETIEIPCDTVIASIGQKIDTSVFEKSGIKPDERGRVPFDTGIQGVYNAGDSMRGPATVVEGIADAQRFADIVTGEKHKMDIPYQAFVMPDDARSRKGILNESAQCEGERCLNCNCVCENCADVCPNRANVVITLPDGRAQILHVDQMCNECGNCKSFCPYVSAPYKDKFTIFRNSEDFDDSENKGFMVIDDETVRVRLEDVKEYSLSDASDIDKDLMTLMKTVIEKYKYLYER